MKFKNTTSKDSKIKILDKKEKLGFRWITAKVGAEVDIPKEVGEREQFTAVKGKGIIGTVSEKLKGGSNVVKGDKDIALASYKEKLIVIDGVGARIVEDVINSYPTEKSLVKAINDKEHLPFRNDVSEKICAAFGEDSTPDDEKNQDETKDDE